jgi:hypothetical protein
MEKKKRRKPEIGTYDVVKVVPVEPVMQVIKAVPLSKEQQTDDTKIEQVSKEQQTEEQKPQHVISDVKKKRNCCLLC